MGIFDKKPKKGEMSVLDHTGDTKHMWDPDNEAEVEAARAIFDSLKKKRYIAYTVKDNGDKGEIINKFDPNLGRIIMAPPVVGG